MLTIQAGRLVPGLLIVFGMTAPGNAGTILIDPSTSVSGTVFCYNGRYGEVDTRELHGQGTVQCDAHGWSAAASWDGRTASVSGDGVLEGIEFTYEGRAEIGVSLALKAVGGSGPGVLRLRADSCDTGAGIFPFGASLLCYLQPEMDVPFTYGQVFRVEYGFGMGSPGGRGSVSFSWSIISDAAVPEPATFGLVFAAAAFGIGLRRFCTGC